MKVAYRRWVYHPKYLRDWILICSSDTKKSWRILGFSDQKFIGTAPIVLLSWKKVKIKNICFVQNVSPNIVLSVCASTTLDTRTVRNISLGLWSTIIILEGVLNVYLWSKRKKVAPTWHVYAVMSSAITVEVIGRMAIISARSIESSNPLFITQSIGWFQKNRCSKWIS